MFTYEPLRILMVKRNVKKMQFMRDCRISPSTANKLWKDQPVALEVLGRICNYFGVAVEEITRHVPEEF